jgi:RNA polymerase sigma factor (sigma-70 family)
MDQKPAAGTYQARNTTLFERRNTLKAVVEKLHAIERDLSRREQEKLHRSLRELNDVTYEIIELNYGLVRSYTKIFSSRASREDAEDFEAAAVVGLMRAIDSFDPTKGKFGQWAYKPIQREVLRAVREAEFKTMAPGDFERRPAILKSFNTLTDSLGRSPSSAEVAEDTGMTLEQVRRVLEAPRVDSLSAMVGEDRDTELSEIIPAGGPDIAEQVSGAAMLTALEQYGLSALDQREKFVLTRRFGLDFEPEQNLSTIGEELHLSREAVRQVEAKALAKIQHPLVLRRIYRNGRP